MTRPEASSSNLDSATHNQSAALKQEIEHLRVLQQISQDLVSEIDIDLLLRNILRSAIRVMDANAGALLLLDESGDQLVFRVVEGGGGSELQGQTMERRHGIAGWVLQNQQAVIVDDTQTDDRHYQQVSESVDFGVTSMVCTPMTVRGRPVGVLQVLNKRSGERFDQEDKGLLLSFAAQSAIAIRNAQLYQELLDERDKLVAVEEDVRKELARDLHDGPTQLVAAIMMNLEFVRRLLKREPHKVEAELGEIEALAERAMLQLRTMLFDLRPIILETQGLIAALGAYSTRLTETESFAVQLEVEDEVPALSHQARSAIFAIVQEAIRNTKKHAQAKNIWLHARREGDTLEVSIRDDGSGFDIAAVQQGYGSRGSLGMVNMRERAELIQGTLTIASEESRGTTVHLTVPLAPNVL